MTPSTKKSLGKQRVTLNVLYRIFGLNVKAVVVVGLIFLFLEW